METSGNCSNTITLEVTIKENPAPEISGPNIVCITIESDDLFYYDIIDTGEHNYTWQVKNGGIIEEDTATGSIGVKWLSEGNGELIVGQTNPISGQTKHDTFHVTILNKPSVEIAGEFLICNPHRPYRYSVEEVAFAEYSWNVEGGSIIGADAKNNVNIEWDIDATSYRIAVVVSISDACESRSENNIELSPFALEGKPELLSNSGCLPFKPQLKNPTDFSSDKITWTLNGDVINSGINPRLTIDEPTIYSLAAIIERDGNQCTDTFTYNVEGEPMPTAAFDFLNEPETLYDNHGVDFRNNSKGGHVYVWETSEGFRKETHDISNVNILFEMPGEHYLTLAAFNEFGCRDTTTMAINVEPEEWMHVPSAFSPNGDGLNDYFQVEHKLVVRFHITIVDRWGTILFTSDDPDFKWDGKVDGETLDPDIYVYKIQARGWSGSIKHKNGTITLMH